jgi:hypothetical protein
MESKQAVLKHNQPAKLPRMWRSDLARKGLWHRKDQNIARRLTNSKTLRDGFTESLSLPA